MTPPFLADWLRRLPAEHQSAAILTPRGNWSANRLARLTDGFATLLHRQGMQPGDRVAVQVAKSIEALALYLACLRNGLVFLPLNTAYQAGEIEYFLNDAEPRMAVSCASNLDWFGALAARAGVKLVFTLESDGGGSLVDAAHDLAVDLPAWRCHDDQLAAIVYTSGTTGPPKGAMLSLGNLYSNARALVDLWDFGPGDTLLHVLPMFHVHGLFVAWHCALLGGSRVHFLPEPDLDAIIATLPDVTAIMGVPTHYHRLLNDERLDHARCRQMRLFISGSAPLLPQTFAAFEARTGHRILERYGMSETGMNLSNPLHGERRPGTVGMPLNGVEARICAEDGSPVTTGETGELQVRGANVFQGYWRMPERTASQFTEDGFFRTGDLASVDMQGYYRIVGRARDLVISGGLNVYPKEVESCIDQMPGVTESAVIGVTDADFGEAVTAVIVCAEDIEPESVISWVRDRLAHFKVPRYVHRIDALPRNTMGKVQKAQLRERFNTPSG